MDVISWTVGLAAGWHLRSLRLAMAIGAGTSVAIRLYQYFVTETWAEQIPEDLIGASAMIGLTLVLTWVGSVGRMRRDGRRLARTGAVR